MGLLTKLSKFVAAGFQRRSPHWPAVRAWKLKHFPTCAACGGAEKLEVHHKMPFHLWPDLELDQDNLITLCESERQCHLHIGHLGNWSKYNPNVDQDAVDELASLQRVARMKGGAL